MISRYVVFEQDQTGTSRVGDIFGVFTSYTKAEDLRKKLHDGHPEKWYGIRQLMNGNLWLKG